MNNFEDVRKSFLNYIESEIIDTFLQPPTLFTLHEIIYFDDLGSVRRKISGAPRGAIHMALNNPQFYLEVGFQLLKKFPVVFTCLYFKNNFFSV